MSDEQPATVTYRFSFCVMSGLGLANCSLIQVATLVSRNASHEAASDNRMSKRPLCHTWRVCVCVCLCDPAGLCWGDFTIGSK